MDYSSTWFGKVPMVMHSSRVWEGRVYWVHSYVEIIGRVVPIDKKNEDGSVSILGVEKTIIPNCMSCGSRDKKSLQKSIEELADELKKRGAVIVKQGRNTLTARKGKETVVHTITHLSAKTFFDKMR